MSSTPLSNDAVESMILAALPEATVQVSGDGYHYTITVISDTFTGLSPVKRQQKIYAVLNQAITSGALHAMTIKTYDPSEAQQITHP